MRLGRDSQAWCVVGAPGFWPLFLRKETHVTEHVGSARSRPHSSPVGVAIITCNWR